jgi:hypothetical protein
MLTMHPTLLVGPADWDPARLPKDEFLRRIAAFWASCDPAISGAIVYGDARSHAELGYLSHFTPKLEPGIALIPRTGEPRLLVGGGINMLAAAKPLTFVETLLPLRDAGTTIAGWAGETGGLALVNGDAMPFGLRQSIVKALGASPPDETALVAAAMRRKSAREMALLREACATLEAALAAMRSALGAGRGMTDVVLSGEHVAQQRGAQDVRSLFGRNGQLAPFTTAVADSLDPLQVYLAVRQAGYWAEGFETLSASPQPAVNAARRILAQAIALTTPGTPHRDLADLFGRAISIERTLSLTQKSFGGSIGLALPQPGCLNAASEAVFAAGEVYTVRVGLREGDGASIVSAMMAITQNGHEVMWPGAGT